MKAKYTVNILIITAIVLCSALNSEAVPNPGAIVWRGSPRAFVTSLYIGVLGRQPENQAVVTGWAAQVNETANSRLRTFWAFINSREYQQSRWSRQPKEYNVYRTYVMQGNFYRYSVSKGPIGADNYLHAGPHTYGVAMALKGYNEAYGRR